LFGGSEFEQQLDLCWHARAVKDIVLSDQSHMHSLKPEDAYEYISDVELQHDQVRHISGGCSCKSDLVLSVSAHESGWPRVIVGSDRAGNLVCRHVKCCSMPGLKRKCRHCTTVCTWLKAIDHDLDMLETIGEDPARLDRLSALAAEMEGYQLLKDNQSLSQGQDTDISTCPVSMSRIQPDIAHPVMQARVKGQLGDLHVFSGTLQWRFG